MRIIMLALMRRSGFLQNEAIDPALQLSSCCDRTGEACPQPLLPSLMRCPLLTFVQAFIAVLQSWATKRFMSGW